MKMQEVIMQLREIAPGVALNTESALDDFDRLRLMLSDALRANSVESVRALVKSCSDKAESVRLALEWARNKAEQLQELNASYKEKIGPRAKKPKDAEGQQILPGMADVAGETGGTPAQAPTWTTSGRHG